MMTRAVSLESVDPFLSSLRGALAGRPPQPAGISEFTPAAVLVPIVLRDRRPHLLFTVRSEDLRTHSGQVSFPGGKVDPGDPDRVATALREAEEEVGLAPSQVEVVGALDEVATPSQFVITPVVGLLAESFAVQVRSLEVAEAFEVPLAALREPGVFTDHGLVERDGRQYHLVAYRIAGHVIWGATARVVLQLLSITQR